jgi:hypothetical protein
MQIKDGYFLSPGSIKHTYTRSLYQNYKFLEIPGYGRKRGNKIESGVVNLKCCSSSLHGLQGSTAGDHMARRRTW